MLRENSLEVKEWVKVDSTAMQMIIAADSSKGSRRAAATITTIGGLAGIVSGFLISASAGDCKDTGGGVSCNNPAGTVVVIGGGIALTIGIGMFFSDTDEVKKLRLAYNSYVMEKRLK